MNNWIGLGVSYLYIGIVLLTGTFISKLFKDSKEFSRKWIHILSGNWIFIAFYFFDSPLFIGIVPATFIFINYFSFKFNLIPAMERGDESLGTVWYAVSLLLASVLSLLIKKPEIAYASILVMAYGDGLAAIVGKKFGKPISGVIFSGKSIVGSLTVFVVSFVSVFGSFYFLKQEIQIWPALLVSVIATFVELSSHNGCDNLTLPIAVGITIFFLSRNVEYFYIVTLINFAIVLFSLKMKALSTDGGVAALLTGMTLHALGGLSLWMTLIAFFILGSIQSKIKNKRKREAKNIELDRGHRDWIQVISNSLPAVIIVWIVIFVKNDYPYILSAHICFAAAAADTFSSEIGMLSRSKPLNILNWKPVEDGISGGVTLLGFVAGLLGSALISLFVLFDFSFKIYLIVVALGFLGTIVDSILGATLQRKYYLPNGKLTEKNVVDGEDLVLAKGLWFFDNNMVNIVTVTLISVIGIAVIYLIH